MTGASTADGKSVAYTFDANGNVAGWTDQNGTVVANTYDARNRLVARAVTRGTGVQGTTSENYTYDALDRLLTATDDDYQVENTWDSVGNLLQQRQGYAASGQEKWKTFAYALDDVGAPTSTTYPSAFVVGYQRDALDRLKVLVDANARTNIATFLWQGVGRRQQTANQNGTSTAYAYDGFARVASIDHRLPGTAGSLHKFEYLYDRAHNRRMEQHTFNATWVATLPAAVQTFLNARAGKGDVFAYDWAYRLVDVRYDVANPATEVANPGSQTYATLVQYTLDGLGNRSQVATTPGGGTTTTVTYATDVVNQYTAVGGVARGHDANGNVADDGTRLYRYDYRNHLTEVRLKSTNALIATYAYDALGRRVEQAVAGGATTRYLEDGLEVAEEYDGNDVWRARYTYEDGIDTPRTMDRADVADVDGDGDATEVLRFTYHQNALGSVTELTSPGGAVVEWTTYDVYGRATLRDRQGTVVAQSAVGNAIGFTGRWVDAATGLVDLRARTYDPATGRFCQRDPLGYTTSLSAYDYGASNPATLVDPTGLSPEMKVTIDGLSPTEADGGNIGLSMELGVKAAGMNLFYGYGTLTWWTLEWGDLQAYDECGRLVSWAVQVLIAWTATFDLTTEGFFHALHETTTDMWGSPRGPWVPTTSGGTTGWDRGDGPWSPSTNPFALMAAGISDSFVGMVGGVDPGAVWLHAFGLPSIEDQYHSALAETGALDTFWAVAAGKGYELAWIAAAYQAHFTATAAAGGAAEALGTRSPGLGEGTPPLKPGEWLPGAHHSETQWANKMADRGWTSKTIDEAIESRTTFSAENRVNPGNAATRYVHPETGRSVVIDDVTKEVIYIEKKGHVNPWSK